MRILITGGSGFIGRNLYESYKDKYTVFVPSHKELELTNLQAVEQYIKKNKINTVIHSAIKGGDSVLESTLRMYLSIFRNLSYLQKFIHFGSGAEYDKSRDLTKVEETNWGKRIPADSYGLAKYICSEISKNNKKIVTLRLFGVYGKYEDYRFKFISNTIAKALLGLPIIIKQNVIFDYLYVDDLVKIIEKFLTYTPPYPDFNITPDKSISLKYIVKIILKSLKLPIRNKFINKNLNFQYTADNKRLKTIFPKFQFTSYEKGISDLIKYYQKNVKSIDKKALLEDKYLKRSKIKNENQTQ